MSVETASWNDILPILRANFRIWSPGLSEADYRHYVFSQLGTSWGRQHLRYVIYQEGGQTKASCKTYMLNLRSHSRTFTLASLGALFTVEKYRGKGVASKLIEALKLKAKQEGLDGILLFSDIEPSFYQSLGFEKLGSAEFAIYLPEVTQSESSMFVLELNRKRESSASTIEYHTLARTEDRERNQEATECCRLDPGVKDDLIALMTRHYNRWLSRQAFGVERSQDYFAHRLGRERFIALHSKLGWPEMIITVVDLGTNEYGYALTECSGVTMRVLEVIGSTAARKELWKELFRKALAQGTKRIRGWESVVSDFAPTFSCGALLSQASGLTNVKGKILSFQRDWGRPMVLLFNEALRPWLSAFPCPLLELDL